MMRRSYPIHIPGHGVLWSGQIRALTAADRGTNVLYGESDETARSIHLEVPIAAMERTFLEVCTYGAQANAGTPSKTFVVQI